MANLLTGPVIVSQGLTEVRSVAVMPLGSRVRDTDGNEFVYVKGVASGAAKKACTFDTAGAAKLLVTTGAVGPVGVMMADLVADTYGFVQVYGKATVKSAGDTADGGLVNTTATGGSVDDASTTRVLGAVFVGAHTGAGDVTVQLVYPTVNM